MTVYLQPKVYRALKVKSATTDRSVSELVNAAVIEALREDAVDVEGFGKRSKEPTRSFEQVLKDSSVTDSYSLVVKKSAERELRAIPKTDLRRITDRLRGLSSNFRPPGCEKLSGHNHYRIRELDNCMV